MNKTKDMISGMLDRVVGRKGCGSLKNEYYDVIEGNRFLWEKLFGIGFFTGKEDPKFGKEWTKHTDNKWLLLKMLSWFECVDNKQEEEYYQQHPHLALQMFSFGIYAGIVIAGKDIEPIVDPNLYDEANYKEYEKEQERIAAEYESEQKN